MDYTSFEAIIARSMALFDAVTQKFIVVNMTPLAEHIHADYRIETTFTQSGEEFMLLISNLLPTAVEMLWVLNMALTAMLLAQPA